MFPVWNRDPQLAAKDEVLGVTIDGVDKAYAVDALREVRVVNDTVGDTDIVIVASGSSSDARVFKRGDRSFESTDAHGIPDTLVDYEGATWNVTDGGLRSAADDELLPRIPTNILFWFGWYAFHPETLLFEP
jgi:hypothetical protein